jgi:hypothetical protein
MKDNTRPPAIGKNLASCRDVAESPDILLHKNQEGTPQ